MADLHSKSQTPERLHAAVASTTTTLNGEDFDSKTPVPSVGDEDEALDLGLDGEKRDEKRDETDEKQEEIASVQNDELSEDEYPSGIKMFFIVLALVLSVFLLSLDMVSLTLSCILLCDIVNANSLADNRRHRHSQNHR